MIDTKKYPTKVYYLSDKEIEFIEFCRELKFGKFTLHVEDTQPEWLEEGIATRKFGTQKTNK